MLVGLSRFELLTPRLSSVCSNQLSYRPDMLFLARPLGSYFAFTQNRQQTPDPTKSERADSLKTR